MEYRRHGYPYKDPLDMARVKIGTLACDASTPYLLSSDCPCFVCRQRFAPPYENPTNTVSCYDQNGETGRVLWGNSVPDTNTLLMLSIAESLRTLAEHVKTTDRVFDELTAQ